MDIQLPEVSGLEVTKWLKDDPELKAIPVVAVTAFAMKGDEERIREGGCEAYLSKPISVGKFIETIRHFLGERVTMTARVLVVDDVPANVKLLEARLSAEYFDVITAKSGAEALAICERAECDIVLLDVMMPDMDGFEVCRRLKSNPAHPPHSGGHGHRARPAVRPRARAGSRRRRFPHQAGLRRRADLARALARAAQDDDRRVAHARAHLPGNRHREPGTRGGGRDRAAAAAS